MDQFNVLMVRTNLIPSTSALILKMDTYIGIDQANFLMVRTDLIPSLLILRMDTYIGIDQINPNPYSLVCIWYTVL